MPSAVLECFMIVLCNLAQTHPPIGPIATTPTNNSDTTAPCFFLGLPTSLLFLSQILLHPDHPIFWFYHTPSFPFFARNVREMVCFFNKIFRYPLFQKTFNLPPSLFLLCADPLGCKFHKSLGLLRNLKVIR